MTLTLQIENFSVLDDGGPVSIDVPEAGLQVGRSSGMGWVLPDASRHISGHHFDIYHQHGTWWLHDRSTNGTFLQGHRHRLDGPHGLQHGDRFQVGQYIIVALTETKAAGGRMAPGSLPAYDVDRPSSHSLADDDPWAVPGGFEPIDPSPAERGARMADFADDFVAFPAAGTSAKHETGDPSAHDARPERAGMPADPPAAEAAPRRDSAGRSTPFGASLPPAPSHAFPQASSQAPSPVAPAPKDKPAAADAASDAAPPPARPQAEPAAFLRAFCRGAGLPAELAADIDAEALGEALGTSMAVTTARLMGALRDRAAARHFTRAGERTMRGASDNNPLKFLPTPEQALEAAFLRPRAGFLTGARVYDDALGDLTQHQTALFAALQPALAELMQDLDPSRIEAEAKGRAGIAGQRKSRAWDSYVERWDAKAAHENGILDEFIRLFADAYRAAHGHALPGGAGLDTREAGRESGSG
ncbi:type VI secretion system-associated FHA domain protein TagH [Paracoccus aurantiacus]|uniref:Type VI secretion system-associated FHA domain protein TagH n=1 Tax=Paracoccus aurantiacus TaxID=2599412 RepID=A0A5C6SC78_9RHOB|nr:type VI secretion system-associated FHA domain protein TagH [Paracoccus aurantiacus]TXB71205.1 type VI secretion system-associated FHA domain protein TagH [Paracoccus aurantiacus]